MFDGDKEFDVKGNYIYIGYLNLKIHNAKIVLKY